MSAIAEHKLQVVLSKDKGLQGILVCNDGHDSEGCWVQDAFEDLGPEEFLQQYKGRDLWLASVSIHVPLCQDEFSFTTWGGADA